MAWNPAAILPDIGPDGLHRENPIIAYTEKIIEAEQLQLKKYIQENYTKIRDVERELTNLTMEMKLTAGPKKAALEHLRKKIETSTEKIRAAKIKEEQARKAWEEATQAVKDEEAVKQKLCDDLNNLLRTSVHESNCSQYSRLEELKRRLEALNPNRASISSPQAQNSPSADASSTPAVPPAVGVAESLSHQVNGVDTQVTDGQNQQPSVEGEGRGKNKVHFQGKGRGVGAVPKGRGSTTPGWTGSGFDVDGRN